MTKLEIGDVVAWKQEPDMMGVIDEIKKGKCKIRWDICVPAEAPVEDLILVKKYTKPIPTLTEEQAHSQFKRGDRVRYLEYNGTIDTVFKSTKASILVKFDTGRILPIKPIELILLNPKLSNLQKLKKRISFR